MALILRRIVSLLLVACLLADPALATAHPFPSYQSSACSEFNRQALNPKLIGGFHPPYDLLAAGWAHIIGAVRPKLLVKSSVKQPVESAVEPIGLIHKKLRVLFHCDKGPMKDASFGYAM